MLSTPTVASCLADRWGLRDASVAELTGGMNSAVWSVQFGSQRWIAKAVPVAAAPHFEPGLALAAHVQGSGIPAGAPVHALDGTTVVPVGDHLLALLSFVDGTPLIGRSDRDLRHMGGVLGTVHRALADLDVIGADRFHWLDLAAAHLGIRDWVHDAIHGAIADWERIPPSALTWGLLHSDPAPEAFLLNEATGVCGLIDWDHAVVGPLMYDVASAVMYVGGPDRADALLEAYVATGALTEHEVRHALGPLMRLRWAVQADYFARRIVTGDMTGIADASENESGLDDARRALT